MRTRIPSLAYPRAKPWETCSSSAMETKDNHHFFRVAVLLNPRWAVLILLSCWRFRGSICEWWAGFKPRAWLQRTPFVLARPYLLIAFRDSLFNLFASLTFLYFACLPFGHFTWHPQSLELSLDRNCRIWCGMSLFPQLLFLECLSHPPLLYHLPLLITGLPTKWG